MLGLGISPAGGGEMVTRVCACGCGTEFRCLEGSTQTYAAFSHMPEDEQKAVRERHKDRRPRHVLRVAEVETTEPDRETIEPETETKGGAMGLVNIDTAAEKIGVAQSWLYKLKVEGKFTHRQKEGRKMLYDLDEIRAAVEKARAGGARAAPTRSPTEPRKRPTAARKPTKRATGPSSAVEAALARGRLVSLTEMIDGAKRALAKGELEDVAELCEAAAEMARAE